MPLVVQKFGGTSVADSEKILAAARKAVRAHQQGNQVVMVVSAMGKNTDVLLDLASEQYFGLDVLGTRIWRLLEQGVPLSAIIEQLLPEFEVDREQFVSDVNRFVSEMLEAGLISR